MTIQHPPTTRKPGVIIAVVCTPLLLTAAFYLSSDFLRSTELDVVEGHLIWRSFSPDEFDELHHSGKTILVVATGNWTLTGNATQVRWLLDSEPFKELSRENGFALIGADVTSESSLSQFQTTISPLVEEQSIHFPCAILMPHESSGSAIYVPINNFTDPTSFATAIKNAIKAEDVEQF